jgi:hypothetical protein
MDLRGRGKNMWPRFICFRVAEGETLWSEICKLVNSFWNKEELSDQWKEPIIVPFYKIVDKLTD